MESPRWNRSRTGTVRERAQPWVVTEVKLSQGDHVVETFLLQVRDVVLVQVQLCKGVADVDEVW